VAKEQRLWCLFSSNIRPLYEQDILDVLAAPRGVPYLFRYDLKHVNDRGRSEFGGTKNVPVLVHFSLQQETQRPVYFPVRRGTIHATRVDSGILLVEFVPGDFVSLPRPPKLGDLDKDDYAAEPAAYADFLKSLDIETPPLRAASLCADFVGDAAAPLDVVSEQHELFDRTAQYLRHTPSFNDAVFIRFGQITSPHAKVVAPSKEGFVLNGGTRYDIEIFHRQPYDVVSAQRYEVATDGDLLRVIGDPGFEIASRYDFIRIPLYAIRPTRWETRETLATVQPAAGVHGPSLRLPFRIRPPRARALTLTAATFVGLSAVGLASIVPGYWKIAPALIGAFVTASIGLFGRV
jgi:hypothetical protein